MKDKKPIFESSQNFFYVTLLNLNYSSNVDQINDQINDVGLEILKIIAEYPGSKTKDIYEKLHAKGFNVSLDQIRNAIKRELKPYI